MIQEVSKGEKLKASEQNKLIREVNDLGTRRVAMEDSLNASLLGNSSLVPTFLQVKSIKSFGVASRNPYERTRYLDQRLWLFLGDYEALTFNTPKYYAEDNDKQDPKLYNEYQYIFPSNYYLLVEDDEGSVGGNIIDQNMLSGSVNGWINSGWDAGNDIWAVIARWEKIDESSGKTDVQKTIFCLSPSSDDETIQELTEKYVQADGDFIVKQKVKIATYNNGKHLMQLHTGQLNLDSGIAAGSLSSDFAISVDADFSAIGLSSLDHYVASWQETRMSTVISVDPSTGKETSVDVPVYVDLSGDCYELFNFHELSVDTWAHEDQLSSYEMVCRRHISSDDGRVIHQIRYIDIPTNLPGDADLSNVGLSSIHKTNDYYQLHRFGLDDDYGALSANINKLSGEFDITGEDDTILVRHQTDNGYELQYKPLKLSTDLSLSVTEISGDANSKNMGDWTCSSIVTLDVEDGETLTPFKIHQLYNFSSSKADLSGRIMLLGGLDSDRTGKVGKIVDGNKNVLNGDILWRDRSTKQLKYMDLSVDEVYVDTYATGSKNKSIQYSKGTVDNDFLTLRNFDTEPNTYISAVLSNGLNVITPEDTWILTKRLTNNQTHSKVLEYQKLSLSVNLSADLSVTCDSENGKNSKSIQHDNNDLMLYDFLTEFPPDEDQNVLELSVDFGKNGEGGWDQTDDSLQILVRDFDSDDAEAVLKYKSLKITTPPLSNLLSGISASISCDTEVLGTQKSIEQKTKDNKNYVQLYDFDKEESDGALSANINKLSGEFDITGEDDTILVRHKTSNGYELQYKTLKLSTDLSGGGGGGSGTTTDYSAWGFNYSTQQMNWGGIWKARRYMMYNSNTQITATGLTYAQVDMGYNKFSNAITIVQGYSSSVPPTSTASYTYVPLHYFIQDASGKFYSRLDYRTSPNVQAWEASV